MTIIRIGVDTSKHVFQLHGVDEEERPVLRRQLRRSQVERFFARLAPTRIGLEACAASHYWARVLRGLGHTVVLIPPQYVKPYVKRGKNDAIDAEAICEAMSRPSMRFVPVRSAANQAELMLQAARELLLKQRTMLVNAIRGHAAEFGVIAAKGVPGLHDLLARIAADPEVPALAREIITMLAQQTTRLEIEIRVLEKKLLAWHRTNERSRRLTGIPGVGPIGAAALAMKVPDPTAFRSGRDFAAWLGLTPKNHSTAGRQRLGVITRAGDETLRGLLVSGATAVIKYAKPGRTAPWLLALLARKPKKLAAVALANKNARIAWAMMMRGQPYRRAMPACRPELGHSAAGLQDNDETGDRLIRRSRQSAGIPGLTEVASVFGARSAEPIWASGPSDRNQQAGHMTASNHLPSSFPFLQAGGRPHMDARAKPGQDDSPETESSEGI